MTLSRWIFAGGLLAASMVAPRGAEAMVPEHVPGTVCLTPTFWCPLPGKAPVGSPCTCNVGYGPVQGVVG